MIIAGILYAYHSMINYRVHLLDSSSGAHKLRILTFQVGVSVYIVKRCTLHGKGVLTKERQVMI